MAKQEDSIELDGIVIEIGRGNFKVKLENNKYVTCTLSGKIRMNKIQIVVGDKVTVKISAYDVTKGIILWRYK